MSEILRYENQTVTINNANLHLTNCHLIGNGNVVDGTDNTVDGDDNIFLHKPKRINGLNNVVHAGMTIKSAPKKKRKGPLIKLGNDQTKKKLKEHLDSLPADFGKAGFLLIPPKPDETIKNLTIDLITCKICYGNLTKVACKPCNHLSMCIECSRHVGETRDEPTCPICKKRITGFEQIYLS